MGEDGRRRQVRLGKVDQRTAEGIKLHIERLVASRRSAMPTSPDTAAWLNLISDELHEAISKMGLTDSRNNASKGDMPLSSMLDAYIQRRLGDLKPWTIIKLGHGKVNMVKFFGEDRKIGSITAAEAQDFRRDLSARYAEATVAKFVMLARQFFHDAVDRELVPVNPFSKVKTGSQKNPERQQFISQEVIQKAINAAPSMDWKLIIAFARYGGVRIPSELAKLSWSDIDFEKGRILIHSPKTEHHAGKDKRVIPLFPELRALLEQAKLKSEPDAVLVVPRALDRATNLRTHFLRILRKAGVKPWPKLFQNLRSTRQTELADQYPIQAVCSWLGNSRIVALDHYLQTTDPHFDRAAGIPPGKSLADEVTTT